MLVHLTSSIFKIHPDKRFSEKYSVPEGVLNYLCSFRFIDWPSHEVVEIFDMIYERRISSHALRTWKKRRVIYLRGQYLLRKNKFEVQAQEFGNLSDFIIYELHLK